MKKQLLSALVAAIVLVSSADAQTINNLGAGRGSVIGSDLFPSYQGANPAVRPSAAQIAAYVYGLASGDLTVNGTGAHTFATVNANVGSFGSTTNCVSLTVNAKGLITAASQAACAPPFTAVTGRATLAQLPQGIANSIWINPTGSTADMTNVAVPACANDGSHALVYVNGSGLACATITAGSTPSAVPRVETGANPALPDTDLTKIVYLSNGSNQIPTIAQAGTGAFTSGWYATYCNIGAGTQTITPATSTIAGAATYVLPAGSAAAPKCIGLVSDGTNYVIVPDYFRFGANVETAAGLALSAAGGLTTTVASGTSALGTSAIGSAACATAVTTSATNTATTDVVLWGFNGDPTAVTGYVPLVAGMLTIIAYPSANNVNFKVCNNTANSITPGAITLNWRVAR